MTTFLTNERATETVIDQILRNKGWIDNPRDESRTVWKQDVKTEQQKRSLEGKRPDFVLYAGKGNSPLAVIEAKAQGKNIHTALEQGIDYAQRIKAPIVFATDGVFTKSFHLKEKQPLFLNEEEVQDLLEYQLALRYLKTNKVDTLDKRVIKSRGELIGIFSKANDLLREEGLQAGIERFSEFSNLLFLKIFSELEEIKRKTGKDSSIPSYMLWEDFKDKEGNELISHLNNIVIQEFSGNYGKDIFKTLSIKNPENLKAIIDSLSHLQLSDTNADIKGDAFEYFIKAYSASNPSDLGEIFTPRHIVQTMVKLLDPKIGEKVYDPFCGTGGMLITAFKHMMGTMAQTEFNLEKIQKETFYGTELTKTAKIAKMNMILAGDGHSNITQADSYQHPVNQEHDVLITNYPFAQKTRYGDLYSIPSRNGDVISPQHCFRALKDGGRMAFIAPEGFLFRQDRALKDVRKFLLNNANLKSVISLPQGCFMPYNGVKASILYFDEVRKVKTKDYFWFFDVKNDGFTLDKRRSKIDGQNDLETVLSERGNATATEEYLQEQGVHKIQVKDVEENNYSLACKQFVKENNTIVSEWPMVELGEVLKKRPMYGSNTPKAPYNDKVRYVRISDISEDGKLKEHQEFVSPTNIEERFFLDLEDVLIARSGTVGRSYIHTKKNGLFQYAGYLIKFPINKELVDPNYFFYVTKSSTYLEWINKTKRPGTISNINAQEYCSFRFPLPPLAVQEEIVKELDGYQKIIDGCRQVVEHYKPHIEIDPSWEMVELGEVCEIIMGQSPKSEYYNTEKKGLEFHQGKIHFTDIKLKNSGLWTSKYNKSASKGSILISVRAPVGTVNITERDVAIGRGLCSIKVNKCKYNQKFLFYNLKSNEKKIRELSQGSTFDNINKDKLKKVKTPLPSLEVQEEIVNKIEQEREAINRCKWLIETYTKKIQDRIDKVWGTTSSQSYPIV